MPRGSGCLAFEILFGDHVRHQPAPRFTWAAKRTDRPLGAAKSGTRWPCGRKEAMAYVLAVGAALANAVTTILQRIGVETAPRGSPSATEPDHPRDPQAGLGRRHGAHGRVVRPAGHRARPRAAFGRPARSSPWSCRSSSSSSSSGSDSGSAGTRSWAAAAAAGGLAAFLTFANPQGGDEVPNVRTWGIAATAGIAAIVDRASASPARDGPLGERRGSARRRRSRTRSRPRSPRR